MANKSLDLQFQADWEKAVAWAQTQGIGTNAIQQVYQYDQSRVAQGDFPMSDSERNHALLAAQNPNKVTQVPSDKPNPVSFLGNIRSNLANIFTGLAPNHLIPNIVHSAATAILHPSSWLQPIETTASGIASGNVGEIKSGLEAAGSQNSILSWVPGVYDLGQLAKGGIDQLATQPITAFLDVAPFAPAGRIASLAADGERVAMAASKLGMTVDQFQKASIPQMGMAWTLMRPLTKIAGEGEDATIVNSFPGAGLLTRDHMRQINIGPDGKATFTPITIGGALSNWSQKLGGLSKAAAGIGAASVQSQILGTDAEMYTMVPYAQAMNGLGTAEQKQVEDLVNDPTKTREQVENDPSLSEGIRDAYSKGKDVLGLLAGEHMASGEIYMVRGPSGTVEGFTSAGEHFDVAQAGFNLRQSTVDAVKALGPANDAFNTMEGMDQRLSGFTSVLEDQREAGLAAPIEGQTAPIYTDLTKGGKPKNPVSLSLARQRDVLLGEHGVVAAISEALSPFKDDGTPKPVDPETALQLTKAAISRLEKEGYGAVQHTTDQSLTQLYNTLSALKRHLDIRIKVESKIRDDLLKMDRSGSTKIAKALKKLAKAQKDFNDVWWKHPSDAWRSVAYDGMIDRLVSMMNRKEIVGDMTQALRENYSEREIHDMQTDPRRMAEALYNQTLLSGSNPHGGPILTPEEMESIYQSGVDHVNTLRAQGQEVQWVPAVSTRDIERYDPGRYGVKPGINIKRLGGTLPRNMHEFTPQRYDLLAAVHLTTKEVIEHNNAVEFVMTQLMPHARGAGEVADWAQKVFPSEYVGRDVGVRTQADVFESHLKSMGLVEYTPERFDRTFGFLAPRFAKDSLYLPKSLADATESLLSHKGFPMDGAYDKATNLFRFSILGLSPRYTAHIVFGGAFLLALRSDPRIIFKMGKAFDMTKDPTHLPVELRQVSAERGVQPAEYRTIALNKVNERGGSQLAHNVVQEDLAKQGIDWRQANPIQWLKAVGDLNYRFTRRVSTMYRAAAMLDYADKALDSGTFSDPVTGEEIPMTAARAREEGVQHALKVMGDLQHMSPLERATFMRIMPFYGWTRHILNYVLSYPVDHPYRAQFLAVQATMNSDSVAKALDTRIQFLFQLGSPDAAGNVSAIDVRFLDPLRDTANYASLSGWISALNPVLSAPLAAIDPNLVYANTSLYPNVTYNQLYGIETSAPQGNPLTAVAENFVGQIGALDAAYQTATNYRGLATTNPNAFYKTVFEDLNIPFAQVQDINLKQLAAKGEDARYEVAKTAAANAWESPGMGGTGIEQALAGYGAVPNPLNVDAGDITPAQLQQIYNAALAAYPGQNPSDVVVEPPNAPGY